MAKNSRTSLIGRRRREPTGWSALLSLAIHLAFLLSLLSIPATQPSTSASEPLSVEMVSEGAPPAPVAAAAEPTAPAAPAEIAPPTQPPEAPLPPVVQAETPPADIAPAPLPMPPVPPTQQAELAPPDRAPTPPLPPARPLQRPSPPVAQARPVQRVVTHLAASRAPASPAAAQAAEGQGHASGAINGAAWLGKLKQWWDQHSLYPKEASQTNEGGSVRVHISISADGQVTSIEVVQGSGSGVLDAAALAVFRNAHLPPFPPGTPAQPGDVVVTLHYRPADSGG